MKFSYGLSKIKIPQLKHWSKLYRPINRYRVNKHKRAVFNMEVRTNASKNKRHGLCTCSIFATRVQKKINLLMEEQMLTQNVNTGQMNAGEKQY
jgi:hypothetical protein